MYSQNVPGELRSPSLDTNKQTGRNSVHGNALFAYREAFQNVILVAVLPPALVFSTQVKGQTNSICRCAHAHRPVRYRPAGRKGDGIDPLSAVLVFSPPAFTLRCLVAASNKNRLEKPIFAAYAPLPHPVRAYNCSSYTVAAPGFLVVSP